MLTRKESLVWNASYRKWKQDLSRRTLSQGLHMGLSIHMNVDQFRLIGPKRGAVLSKNLDSQTGKPQQYQQGPIGIQSQQLMTRYSCRRQGPVFNRRIFRCCGKPP